ncbi:hypothetical protein BJ973_009223 [Actinoplanes tereljensis]|uniref:FtsX-like permease family protein n=1 Tax=Paractinoplanes tereljensis TaxID=571912 RepID=A0A919NG30_9ACTN|nr:hypothetical protein [Actinoplanes tereljensis]GIF17813.1 hypothetical protein Ate02nite_05430 [Actinoplanes tereljensis]
MIGLVLAMLWTRRGQSVTLGLLALFAVAAAVASPAYLIATDRAVAAGQIATATPAERGVVITANQDDRTVDPGTPDFSNVGAALLNLPGFGYTYAAEFPAIGIEKDNLHPSRFTFRQGVCAHLRIVAGRCLAGEGEVLLGQATAARLHLTAGSAITLTYGKFVDDPRDPYYTEDGEPKRLDVAGIYEVPEPGDIFWGTHGYWTAVPNRGPGEPVFAGATTLKAFDHGRTEMSIDGTAGPRALDIDHLDELRAGLAKLNASAAQLGPTIQIDTSMPYLLDRIEAGRSAARVLIPVLGVPLVLLACFSIFLAVSYGSQGRQPELALVALRGTRWWTRWWLATGESLIAILLGAVAGCLAGQLLVDAVTAARFGGIGSGADWSSLRYAPIAALAALAAAVLAQRRQLLSPVATLLRRNPVAANGPRAVAVEAVIVLLAVISGVQLALSDGELTGIGRLAPAFIVLAVALLAARALLPLITGYATRALRGGRLGAALAAFQLSRRPGAQRLFALLVATVAVAGYGVCAVDAATRGREMQAGLGVGADRVLTVEPLFRSQLRNAVEQIDPHGEFAMAVARMPSSTAGEPAALAVDATRLAAVATWPGGAAPAAEVGTRLRPPTAAPILLQGEDLSLTATGSGMLPGRPLVVALSVTSLTGLGDAVVQLGELHVGRWTYQQRAPVCAQGCRLNGIQLNTTATIVGVTAKMVVSAIGTVDPALLDPAGWLAPAVAKIAADPDGLLIDLDAASGLPTGAWIRPADTPSPLPAAYAGEAPIGNTLTDMDGALMPVELTDRLPAVPRLGQRGALVDLEYADRTAATAAVALEPQVWLNDRAPADILDRLGAAGLTVTGDNSSAAVRRQLDEQGPALALWFYLLAGALSVLLGAGALVLAAAVDRARRVEDLAALRTQGLRRRTAARATLWTYPVLVAFASLVGVLTGLATWAMTGWALPLAGLNPPSLPLPGWPGVRSVAVTTLLVLILLTIVAAGTGGDLHRRIDRGTGN